MLVTGRDRRIECLRRWVGAGSFVVGGDIEEVYGVVLICIGCYDGLWGHGCT